MSLIYNGDCFEEMKKITNKSIKYILIEKDSSYFRITEERVLKAYLQNEILD